MSVSVNVVSNELFNEAVEGYEGAAAKWYDSDASHLGI